jgi:hypothetical protein
VIERGEWRTVIEDMGMPSEKKGRAVDLTGNSLEVSRSEDRDRMCVYWTYLPRRDRTPEVRLTAMDAERPRFRGFQGPDSPGTQTVERFVYDSASGFDVEPDVAARGTETVNRCAVDDRLAVGSGTLRLSHDAARLPSCRSADARLPLQDG